MIAQFWRATIGKKVTMAVTGAILVGFLVEHVIGNLLNFGGARMENDYAAGIKAHPMLVWSVRGVLLAAVVLHIIAALQLSALKAKQRPIDYDTKTPQASTFASRTMLIGGITLLIFIPLHLLHFTTGTLLPSRFIDGDPYGNVVRSFSLWWVALLYIAVMVALGLHLFHGAWSAFQTLGANHPGINVGRRRFASALAILIWLGFTIIPLAVIAGVLHL